MILEASNISKSYKLNDKSIPILEHFDFQADAGEKIAVTGPSGSGKSTLLNLLSGLDNHSAAAIMERDTPFLPVAASSPCRNDSEAAYHAGREAQRLLRSAIRKKEKGE